MASPKSEVIGRCCLIACERDPILTTDGRTDVRAYSVQESEKKGGSYIYKYIMIIPLTVHYCSTYNKGFFDNAIFNFQLNSIENLLKCLTRQRSIFFSFSVIIIKASVRFLNTSSSSWLHSRICLLIIAGF